MTHGRLGRSTKPLPGEGGLAEVEVGNAAAGCATEHTNKLLKLRRRIERGMINKIIIINSANTPNNVFNALSHKELTG